MVKKPTFAEIPPANEAPWKGISEEDYERRQKERAAFKRLPLSKSPYLRMNGGFDQQELAGFCAAGVLFWRRGMEGMEVLMVWEDRWDKWGKSGPIGTPTRGLVLLGGMRDTKKESPRDVAVREALTESKRVFSGVTQMKLECMAGTVAWLPRSKYCVHFFQVTEDEDMDADSRFNALPRGRAGGPIPSEPAMVALAWVPLRTVLEEARGQKPAGGGSVHEFALDMFRTLDGLGAFATMGASEERPPTGAIPAIPARDGPCPRCRPAAAAG